MICRRCDDNWSKFLLQEELRQIARQLRTEEDTGVLCLAAETLFIGTRGPQAAHAPTHFLAKGTPDLEVVSIVSAKLHTHQKPHLHGSSSRFSKHVKLRPPTQTWLVVIKAANVWSCRPKTTNHKMFTLL